MVVIYHYIYNSIPFSWPISITFAFHLSNLNLPEMKFDRSSYRNFPYLVTFFLFYILWKYLSWNSITLRYFFFHSLETFACDTEQLTMWQPFKESRDYQVAFSLTTWSLRSWKWVSFHLIHFFANVSEKMISFSSLSLVHPSFH